MMEITARYGRTLCPDGSPPPDTPSWTHGVDNPYLHGLYAPVTGEVSFEDLQVEGEIPSDLVGAYLRNGPNPRYAPRNRYHWFDGDGMVHGVWFEGGRARYARRWIRTRGLAVEAERGASVWPGVLGPFDPSLPGGPLKDTANTDLVEVDGRVLALWYESGRPVSLDPQSLETLEESPFGGRLGFPISAHSRVCPQTGDFVFFSYGDRPPYMRFGLVDRTGHVHSTDITLPGPRRPHDFGLTRNYAILHDFPVFFDPDHFRRTGKRVPRFHPDVATRFGVIPRRGTDADVQWFSFGACYMLHVVNSWEEGDEIVMIGCRNADPTRHPDPRDGRLAAMLAGLKLDTKLHEWRMNLATGASSERQLDDLNAEFPMIAPSVLGSRGRYAYLQHIPCEIPVTFDGLVKYDLQSGCREVVPYGPGVFGSEAPFARRVGGEAEDDGYLLTFVTDVTNWSSACWIYRANDLTAGPIAKIAIPLRVPAGFHATWVPA